MHGMYSREESKKGFTLIELLVVIAIIGLLSSVVLASVNAARVKAKDAAIKSQVRQLVTVMALEYSETGTYTNLESGTWRYTAADCNSGFSGNYAVSAKNMCVAILSNTDRLFTGNAVDPIGKFSIMASLPGKGTYFCSGSSGASSDVEPAPNGSGWANAGCYSNP
ncbi:MAG: prepilin peptidase dependent protein type pilus assembly protein PilA [Parcubacteria group bacterium]|nr:prepilin peptidase dependent protein type pilus assembly protein PilA [Parcubacteria group bacterium]